MKRLIAVLILATAGNAYGVTFDKILTAGDHAMFKEYVTNECAMLTPDHLIDTDLERNLFKTMCEVTAMGAIYERFDSILALPLQAAEKKALKPSGNKVIDALVKHANTAGKIAADKYIGYGKD
ncbi:hypothetical protein A9332_000868 [Escherichia coli]|nr:hypothetical protein [Escherichia coli]